jgi:Protein of unknown function (DUF1700)
MSSTPHLPMQASSWLRAVEAGLSRIDSTERDELVDGLRSHIQESIDAGDPVDDVLHRLGDPSGVADEMLQQATASPVRYLTTKRFLQLIGVVLAAAASIALCVLPSFVSVTTDSSGNEKIEAQNLLQAQGLGFLIVLLIPVLIAAVPLLLHGRAWRISSVIAAVLITGFAVLGALSIGRFYIPAAIVQVVAACLPSTTRKTANSANLPHV